MAPSSCTRCRGNRLQQTWPLLSREMGSIHHLEIPGRVAIFLLALVTAWPVSYQLLVVIFGYETTARRRRRRGHRSFKSRSAANIVFGYFAYSISRTQTPLPHRILAWIFFWETASGGVGYSVAETHLIVLSQFRPTSYSAPRRLCQKHNPPHRI